MPAKNGRNVALTAEQNALIQRLVHSGRYASASEVVRDGLRLLQRDEDARLLDKWLRDGLTPEEEGAISPAVLRRAHQTLREKVAEALDEAARGELVDGKQFFDRWGARLKAAKAAPKRSNRKKRRV